mmetsp:Transcript_3077/g.7234  ORF Transcript_3077/g.7234 Transcript_3077/m.7234 type:complete len:89 (-) Transcript_3077:279-545(-)|eukprot:CAMPEP_0113628046 /NCGR_PEP_ID=MMETSP0017_2-20120614/14530_1 /TAXON_ID=2856 /ORGANISM="Cylindrotheca closterium" /LENGTH=88 /DNA_ID=CAMNT_0000538333 /DNA_START=68 /DNA_END=334 /DNA_ORIENTATION=+ /assembly_acc=CAM_ASM_000147
MSSLSEKKMYATVLGAVAAAASAGLALYTFNSKGAVEGKQLDGDEETVESELSATPPELTEEEKKAVEEAKAAAHKRLKEKCMVKKSS